ncbi:MAG: phosphate ABC transporter substrate-binding protein PstS [Gemmataceae bacterium]|nr:phosphate ABC transporter substrate-binding protein PstS [Gemmataceae bacterium]
MKRMFWLGLALGLLMASAPGCSRGEKRVNAGGASFIYPMMSKWTSEYKKAKGVGVNYTSSGSGAGIEQMIAKTYDFGCSDAPMTDKQIEKARAAGGDVVHIPLAMGAVVPTYNLEEATKPLRFTGEILAEIYLGKIKKWNDPRLQALQEEGVTLPDKDIAVVYRSDGSGTTYIFAEYLAKCSPEWKKEVGVATSLKWRAGSAEKGNEGVANYVKNTPGALGYNELTYALQNNLKFGAVKNKAGNFLLGDLKSVTAAADASLENIPEDLRYSLTDAPGKDSYPITGTNWAVLYVNQTGDKGKLIVDYLRWVTHDGQSLCEALHYARLPQSLIERVEKRLALIKTAS